MKHFARMATAVAAFSVAVAAIAETYPSRPITIVVPFAAGSATDALTRVIGKRLSERLNQPIVVENRAGANAQVGAQYVAQAKPDGYTLLMATNTSHAANSSLYAKLRYDPVNDFSPIARVAQCPFALAVNLDVPAKTVKEFIEYAKANPGRLSYATPNSTSQVASETFRTMANLNITGIPYKSSPQAMIDLMRGDVQMYIADVSSGMSMFKAGKVRVLGMTTSEAFAQLPGVPPISETLPGFNLTSWHGLLGPAKLPADVVRKLSAEVSSVLAEAEVQTAIAQINYKPWPTQSPEEFGNFIREQIVYWNGLVKRANIKPEGEQ
ncbi:tripartite tricarboxylate transporter substrate binding protein [Variovorax sp. J31P179]|uniref:Bug family tripartite tricarboxylate transporter substrate binding protein n=1 Tax=Variovorax sp. J31P179 TaxID=3053508 RepID=UPI002576F290|nr:tripartite tricarboxylate transporter substrate binding protein [Variovorax sp. J31P179]MDM0085362.1 tripartite tricarboxylate transporter substrate binding protein [Variovorax sp. J31P179]